MKIEEIAKVAHEVNKAYCEAIGDKSQLPWHDAPAWQKESAIKGVEFHKNNPNSTPESSHNSWLKEKISNGWKYGSVKDESKKEHPCCLPYSDLPTEQKAKDYIFRSVVTSLLSNG